MKLPKIRPILRALSGKNKAGKAIYKTVGGLIGVSGAYVATESIGFNETQQLISLALMVVTFLAGMFVKNFDKAGKLLDALEIELIKATADEGDGGSKITRAEAIKAIYNLRQVIREIEDEQD